MTLTTEQSDLFFNSDLTNYHAACGKSPGLISMEEAVLRDAEAWLELSPITDVTALDLQQDFLNRL